MDNWIEPTNRPRTAVAVLVVRFCSMLTEFEFCFVRSLRFSPFVSSMVHVQFPSQPRTRAYCALCIRAPFQPTSTYWVIGFYTSYNHDTLTSCSNMDISSTWWRDWSFTEDQSAQPRTELKAMKHCSEISDFIYDWCRFWQVSMLCTWYQFPADTILALNKWNSS